MATEPEVEPAGRRGSIPRDLVVLVVTTVGLIFTWAQLPPGRAVWVTAAAVAFVVGSLTFFHGQGRVKMAIVSVSTLVFLGSLVAVQLQPQGGDAVRQSASPIPGSYSEPSPSASPSVVTSPAAKLSPSNSVSPKPVEQVEVVIRQGDSASVFAGDLSVAAVNVYGSFASLTIATTRYECSGTPDVGQSLVIVDPQERWNRVVLKRVSPSNMTVTVLVIRGTGERPTGARCWS